MNAWLNNGIRVDVELAVAFEIACLRLGQGDVRYAHQVWRLASAFAPDLAEIARQAAHAPAEQLTQLSRAAAARLAGRAPTNGALRTLLEAWKVARQGNSACSFDQWLVERLAGLAPVLPMAA